MKKKYFFLVLTISLFSHLLFFGFPREVVFDESFFGKFSQDYLKGKYFFDIHPPLGKMLIAGTAKIMGFSHFHEYWRVGQYSTDDYLILRALPLVAGIFLGPLLYLVARKLRFSERASVLAGVFASMDSALVTQSRFILIDSLLLLFGLLSIYFFLGFRESFRNRDLFAAGFFGIAATSVKWTGLGFLGLIIFFWLLLLPKSKDKKSYLVKGILVLVAVPAVFYFSVFTLHFHLLGKAGDDFLHTPAFRKTLEGSAFGDNPNIKPLSNFEKFIEENSVMYIENKKLGVTHDYSSKWYSWPFLGKSVFYWGGSDGVRLTEIRLLGNPVIWWSGFLSAVGLFGILAISFFRRTASLRKGRSEKDMPLLKTEFVPLFVVAGFLMNFIPFIFIHRYMFSYHYLPALLFSILALGYLVDKLKNNKKILFFLYAEAVLFYLILFPLTYGISMAVR
jgi:dolichyl-phosphate-mannose-protein mannosyltransferase